MKNLILVGVLSFLVGLAVRPTISMLSGGYDRSPPKANVSAKEVGRNPAVAARDELLAKSGTDLRNPLRWRPSRWNPATRLADLRALLDQLTDFGRAAGQPK